MGFTFGIIQCMLGELQNLTDRDIFEILYKNCGTLWLKYANKIWLLYEIK
jgi:hypothetical protein